VVLPPPLLRQLSALLLVLPVAAGPASEGSAGAIRLVVVVSVDQLSHVAIDPLRPHLEGGLARFFAQGSYFPRAEVAHGVSETAPGHASLGTGCVPARHGIVANEWIVRSTGRPQYCYADPDERPLRQQGPAQGAGRSARNLRRAGLAELLRAADGASRSVAIAGKDRAAIGMLGRAEWCLWWDQERGGFQSSTAWGPSLPDWVRAWNARWLGALDASPFGAGWQGERADALEAPPADERPGEGGRRFPYARPPLSDDPSSQELARLAGYVYATPACDRFVIELALAALDGLELGADDHADVLALGLSGCDAVGHGCGPQSREVADLLLCADAALGELFARLDEKVGAGRWIAALSADHGVMPLPEALAERGIDARRITGREVGQTLRAARAQLEQRYGSSLGLAGDARGLTLSARALADAQVDAAEAREVLARAVAEAGEGWVERALTWDRLRAVAREGAAAEALVVLEAASFDEERAPDVSIVSLEYALVALPSGTSHGSPHAYDRSVPLVFLGRGFEPGASEAPARTIDLVPTLLDRAGIPVPAGLDGRVLAGTHPSQPGG